MKVVILDGYVTNPNILSWDQFKSISDNVEIYDDSDRDQALERAVTAEAIFTNKTKVDKKFIDNCPNLKFVGTFSTGYNGIDIDYASSKGIVVCNVPSYGTKMVSQYAFSLLLEVANQVAIHSESVYNGDWSKSKYFCYWKTPILELSEKTIGIIGFGRIGQQSAKVAKAFGMKVIYYDIFKSDVDGCEFRQLDKLYGEADVIFLHCNLTADNERMINKNSIALMKKNVIIINNARGALINEEDLAEALNSGRIYGAGLDTVAIEPIKEDNPLLSAKNCFITPHISWISDEARGRIMQTAYDNIMAFISGKPINVVNSN